MDIKRLIRLTQIKQVNYVIFATIFGIIYSLYKFDFVHWGLMFLFLIVIISAMLGFNLLKELMNYRFAETDEEIAQTKVERLHIDLDMLRRIMWLSFAISIVSMVAITMLSTWKVAIFLAIGVVIGIIYVGGKHALVYSPLNEVVLSFGLGFYLPLVTIYINTYFEQLFIFDFIMEILWVTLPLVLALMIVSFGYNLIEKEKGSHRVTLVSLMTKSVTEGLMELMLFLAFVLPLFSIYLDYAPWTMIVSWIIFPKLWMNLRHFENQRSQVALFPYVREIATVIMMFQILLYTLGLFF